MAMFDDVDKKLSGWFNAGAEKAKGMSETLRLSNAIREEETKQAELYRQMGKYFYDYFAVAAEGKMKEWCDGVKASQQQVQVYKEQIQTEYFTFERKRKYGDYDCCDRPAFSIIGYFSLCRYLVCLYR